MQEVNFRIDVEAKDAKEKVEAVKQEVNETSKATEDLGEKSKKDFKKLDDSAKKSKKSVRGVGKGFRLLGTAMKAAGIGLVVAVVAKLTQAFSQNQKVMDAVNTVFQTINIVFTEVTNAIINGVQAANEATGGFDALRKVMSGLLTIALTPIQLAFNGIKLGIQQAQLAWEQSFFGDGDPETIKELNEGINETKDTIVEIGKDAIQSGKDVVNNFGEAIGEVGKLATETSKRVTQVSIQSAKDQANTLVELRKQVRLGEASLAGLTLQFQNQAELLRQERDDIRLSIQERIRANEKLGEVLRQQAEEELEIANKKLSLARQELALNPDNIEAQEALIMAKNDILDIEERITGQKSEQRVNEAALLEERKANLRELEKIGKTEEELKRDALRQELEDRELLIQKTAESEEKKNQLLLAARKQYNEGIKALEEEKAKNEEKANEAQVKREKITQDMILNQASQTFGALAQILGEQSKAGKAFAIADALINTYLGITKALASVPFPLNIAAAVTTGLQGFAAVKNILNTDVENPSPSGGGGRAARPRGAQQTQAQAPDFNVVGNAGTNQIAQTLSSQSERPSRAYVVSKDISSQQELDRNIEDSSSLG